MARKGGAGIEFGKVAVYSAEEDLNDVYATFAKVMTQFGYPEEDIEYELVEEDDEQEEEQDMRDPDPWESQNG